MRSLLLTLPLVALAGCASAPVVTRAPGSLPGYVHNDYRRGDPPLRINLVDVAAQK